jgi:hypothetical protein
MAEGAVVAAAAARRIASSYIVKCKKKPFLDLVELAKPMIIC